MISAITAMLTGRWSARRIQPYLDADRRVRSQLAVHVGRPTWPRVRRGSLIRCRPDKGEGGICW
jgi:hypothetical protein